MRLLKLNDDGSLSLESFRNDKVPPYAILSHTWGRTENYEVEFEDITDGTGYKTKRGFEKLRFCGEQAKVNDLNYFWVDTCCIHKSNNSELTTAINSMFSWYQKAERCYVYLSDVSVHTPDGQPHMEWDSSFRSSRWFTRGWTLQELLAPKIVEFYSRDRVRLGDKNALKETIHEITQINIEALQGQRLDAFSIKERSKWAENRQTTEEEDKAYCLLGIFGVSMPLVYGEGSTRAMRRLHKAIHERGETSPRLLPAATDLAVQDFPQGHMDNTKSERNPILWASAISAMQHNNLLDLKEALEQNPDLIEGADDNEWTLFHHAVKSHAESGDGVTLECLIQLLLKERGRESSVINSVCKAGKTPVFFAVEHRFPAAVELLVEAGANVNQADKCGVTPLKLAYDGSDSKMMDILIKRGASVEKIKDKLTSAQWDLLRSAKGQEQSNSTRKGSFKKLPSQESASDMHAEELNQPRRRFSFKPLFRRVLHLLNLWACSFVTNRRVK